MYWHSWLFSSLWNSKCQIGYTGRRRLTTTGSDSISSNYCTLPVLGRDCVFTFLFTQESFWLKLLKHSFAFCNSRVSFWLGVCRLGTSKILSDFSLQKVLHIQVWALAGSFHTVDLLNC